MHISTSWVDFAQADQGVLYRVPLLNLRGESGLKHRILLVVYSTKYLQAKAQRFRCHLHQQCLQRRMPFYGLS